MARNTFVRDQKRRELEYKARCLHGELLDSGWPANLAPYAALYYVGAKSIDWLKEHFKPDAVEYICKMR